MLKGRLVGLREYRREDVTTLFPPELDPEYISLTEIQPYRPRPLAAHLAEYDRRMGEHDAKTVPFAVQRLDDESGTAIGRVGLWMIDLHQRTAHIGISLPPSAQGQGFGRDALEVICRYGFEIRGLERLSLETLSVNAAMQATALACGFVEEGRLRSAAWHLGDRVDEVVYGLLADEWRQRRGGESGAMGTGS
jgi:RimJ/RimL family protein N-acetyltransferase